jgi:hypothetical protein
MLSKYNHLLSTFIYCVYSSIALYIFFKRGSAESVLLDKDGNEVYDVLERKVNCHGSWNDPKNVTQFLSAVTRVHDVRNQKGAFFDLCELCLDEDKRGNFFGCQYHRGTPLLWRKGNPARSNAVKNALAKSTKEGNLMFKIPFIY